MSKKRVVVDEGMQLIDDYQRAIVQARLEHLSTGGHTADVITQERASIEALAARIGDAIRAEYAARRRA